MQQFLRDTIGLLDSLVVGGFVLFIAAMMCMLIIGNPMIAWLQQKRWKKGTTADETWTVREDTPDTHLVKTGTPSMGGIGIIFSTVIACTAFAFMYVVGEGVLGGGGIPWQDISQLFKKGYLALYVVAVVLISHGILGFADDWSKASGRGGLQARHKLICQLLLGMAFLVGYYFLVVPSNNGINSYYQATGNVNFISLAVLLFALVATCNAVNLTDGIDGLAAGLAVQGGLVLFIVHRLHGFDIGATYSAWTCLALAGACFGFLYFNKHKARVFMGDTGSLAIGAALGAGAIIQHAVFLLPFIGFIYFVEMFSVIAQVLWFKWTKRKTGEGKRLLRRAPLHHHFEMGGWSEWRVVGTFWMINLFTSAIGLWLWGAEVLPRWP